MFSTRENTIDDTSILFSVVNNITKTTNNNNPINIR